MRRAGVFLLALMLQVVPCSVCVAAESAQSASTAPASQRLAQLDGLLQRYVDRKRLAGAVALVLQDGQPIYERAVGWSDKEAGRRMQVDTIFRIASQTKAVTSAAILMLVDEGKIALSDPASKFIPAFANATVAVQGHSGVTLVRAKRPMTIEDLLTHTSGLSYGTESQLSALYRAKGLGPAAGYGWYLADKREPVCTTMERLATLPLAAHPGDAWIYGYSTDVLGCVIERASGVALDEFIRTRITGPLGMRDTHFFLPANQRERLATLYASGPGDRVERAPEGPKGQGDYIDGPARNFSGGAGLLSTARDYARFLEMIRNGGTLDGVPVLASRTVMLMSTDFAGARYPTEGLGFGLGFEIVEAPGRSEPPGAFGWGGAYGTIYRVDPQNRLVIVLMIQLLPNRTDLHERFLNEVYEAMREAGSAP